MARLRQQYPQNYGSSTNINTEFESVVRYLNAAELGENTVGELLAKIFDEGGNFDGPIQITFDSTDGLKYRIGEYTNTEDGWIVLASAASLRGPDGKAVGEIGAPIFFGRADTVAAGGQTVVDYAHDSGDELLVYVDGVLKRPGGSNDYTSSATGGSTGAGAVTFNSGLTSGDVVSIFKVRTTSVTGYTRTDTFTSASQTNFPFTFDETTKLQVYKNGILQREGSTNDYTPIPAQNIVGFNTAVPAGNLVTILTVENTATTAVTGLMFEETYTDSATGLINYAKLSVANNEIPQAKVNNLPTALAAKAKLTVSASAPSGPATGDLWHDSSQTPNQLKFYDGTSWIRTAPESSLPTFATSNAGQYVRVNGAGTALEYGNVDLTSVIPVNQKGVASGVATLDATGRLPSAQLPETLATDSIYQKFSGTLTAGNLVMKRVFKQVVRIDGISVKLASGTCDVQLTVNGTAVTSISPATFAASTTINEQTLGTTATVTASTNSQEIGINVSNVSTPVDLEVTMAVSILSS